MCQQLLDRGGLIHLLERRIFGGQAVQRGFIDLPLGEGLVRLAGIAVQVAHHFGDGRRVAGIDLRLIFLRPA